MGGLEPRGRAGVGNGLYLSVTYTTGFQHRSIQYVYIVGKQVI